MSHQAKPRWEAMTFSNLQRYVMVCECVLGSGAFLAPTDRVDLIHTLLDSPHKLTPEGIERACQVEADKRLGTNMVNAQILRQAHMHL